MPYAAAVASRRVPCVGAVVKDASGRMLMVRRGRPPGMGLWSLPGGRVEPGESDEDAVVREVWEETGLAVTVGRLLGTAQIPTADGDIQVVRDYECAVVDPSRSDPRPGDDAADARWVTLEEVRRLPTSPGLLDALTRWGVLPT
ncbi:ADP-ribose pyrophosphatase YjhB (NUDIX family) [Thermasporomyces composti]|jgi:ADP-ribose pyrophosphatase YjhB (NUDIX family)|uniref:ADP-ribose pyrophosphatase YjhB (NUDIX family) n=1 Tax=Thermasporomyces composti TaxID=696763 RepID=A0A3D9V174_THECX|nr:ADP-ribose pyrophosphatase YjhB (NUDIX family) [Thermasporomyces composti]